MPSITSWYLRKAKLDKADSTLADTTKVDNCEVDSGNNNYLPKAESRKLDIVTSTILVNS